MALNMVTEILEFNQSRLSASTGDWLNGGVSE